MRIGWLCHTTLAAGLLAFCVAALEPVEASGTNTLVQGGSEPAGGAVASEIEAARQRLKRANASYSNMMARHYPRGDARATIVSERHAAEARLHELLHASGSTNTALPPPAMRW